jgi:hypothetical protein
MESVTPLEELARAHKRIKRNPKLPRFRPGDRVLDKATGRAGMLASMTVNASATLVRIWVRFDDNLSVDQPVNPFDLQILTPTEELARVAKDWGAKKNPPLQPPVPDLVRQVLLTLGLEVGDYHQDVIWVLKAGKVYQARLEGWGEDCVPGKGRKAAQTAASKLAQDWFKSWPQAGWVPAEDDEVWAVTWALRGPFPKKVLVENDVDPESVVRL